MAIDFQHTEYIKFYDKWSLISDVLEETDLEKRLLPLNPLDTSPENAKRNQQYKDRAIFYSITAQTVQGMVGSVFRKLPELEIPAELEYLKDNADGAGVSIYQSSQRVCRNVLGMGRAGIAVSFPQTEGQVSRADIISGRVTATIHNFAPDQILNWRVIQDGSRLKLGLVIIKETEEEVGEDGYSSKTVDTIRELALIENVYTETVWRKTEGEWRPDEPYTPRDSKGQLWDEIPFAFVGSENNDHMVDNPPMLGIASLNIGHYRNSADYEDSVWYSGQAQPWMSGVTQNHIELLTKNNMYSGSRNLIAVPEGETFGYASASPNPMVRQAMVDKQEGMVAMGARLMQQGSATKTATQAAGDIDAQTSLLSMVAGNVSEAYTMALGWCAKYMGAKDTELSYTLNKEFINTLTTPQLIKETVASFMIGGMPLADYTRNMRKMGQFSDDVTDEDYAELLSVPGVE